MAKPLFQDIIPPDRRSIKHIPVPPRGSEPLPRRPEPPQPPRRDTYTPRPTPPPMFAQERPQPPRRRSRGSRILITLLVIGIIIGIAAFFMSRANGATIVITPKEENVTVDAEFKAEKDSTQGLSFEVMTFAKDGKLAVATNGQELANTKASGVIVIYNTTATAQMLVANTRFQTNKGLIFRISQPVTIPARTVENGKTVPGSIEAAITADAVGPDYNVGLADFTIPGFKGDPKFEQIYARSKTQIQGGFSGMRGKVDEKELATARERVRGELKTNLIKASEKDIPSGYVLPANAYFIEYESLPETITSTGVQINERATFHGFIFERTALAEHIVKKMNGVATLPADIKAMDSLNFSVTSPTKNPWSTSTIQFTLKGSTTLVSVVDIEKLKQELISQPRVKLNLVLANYPGVTKAQVTMRPFWESDFPNSKDKITITIANPQ
jgi:hypothetical protein